MKYLTLLLALLIVTSGLDAQQRLSVRKKDFKIVQTGLKDSWKLIKEGNKLFDKGPGTFRDARNCYIKAYRYNPNCAALNYNIGLCYLFTDEKYEAIKYLSKAAQSDPPVAPDIKYLLGRAYHLTLEFDKAISSYTDYLNQLGPDNRSAGTADLVNRLIDQCRNGKELVAKRQRVVINNLGARVNSVEDDYNPVFSADEKTMYFTSRRQQNEKDPRNRFDNKFFEDIYVTRYDSGRWSEAQRMQSPLNTKKNNTNNSAVALSADGTKMFLYEGRRNAGDILWSEKLTDTWSKPKFLKGKVNSIFRETSLCITRDGNTLYFISDNKKTTIKTEGYRQAESS